MNTYLLISPHLINRFTRVIALIQKSIELKRHESERNVQSLREQLRRLEHVQEELQQTASERDEIVTELNQERYATQCIQQGFDAVAKVCIS